MGSGFANLGHGKTRRLAGASTFGQIMLSIDPRGSARQSAIHSNLDFGTFSLKFSPLQACFGGSSWTFWSSAELPDPGRLQRFGLTFATPCSTMPFSMHTNDLCYVHELQSPTTPMCSCVLVAGLGICVPQICSEAFASGSWKCE